MHEMIQDTLYLIIFTIVLFLGRKYVFFEPELDRKKQRFFYVITFVVAFIVQFAFSSDYATDAVSLMVGINIFLARKKHKLAGVLVGFLPLNFLVYGFLDLFLDTVPYFFSMSEQAEMVYDYVFYGVSLLLLTIFYVKGKAWRSWFDENMQYRSLNRVERWLLYIISFSQLFVLTDILSMINGEITVYWEHQRQLDVFLAIRSFTVFFVTIAIIGLILRENKRYFYYKKVLGMQSGMITLMADMVENRDDNTGGHIKRTASYVECIAKELKKRGAYRDILTDEYMKNLIVAAPLHDIGKIHVPDAVLNKPGRLTDKEFAVMKAHTTAGHDLLNHAKEELGEYGYLTMAVEMAAYHHEWWNGSGYPYGVTGNDIPLCARIMAVADVFDALISKRIYKDAMPLEKAYGIIREESGTHFEPEIVEAFFAVTDEIEAIAVKEKD